MQLPSEFGMVQNRVTFSMLCHPAGVQIFYCHIPTVCASGTARVGYYCFVPPEQDEGACRLASLLFRRNKIIIAHACSAGGTNRGNMTIKYSSPSGVI